MSDILLGVAIASALCGAIASVVIGAALQERGVKVNWFLYRILIVTQYLRQYHDVTLSESGRVGPWYYVYTIGMSAALAFATIGLLLPWI